MGRKCTKSTRKYLPMTHLKRIGKKKKNLDLALKKLCGTRNFLINRAQEYFETMSQQSQHFKKMSQNTCIPWQNYQRLTASRVYYVFEQPQRYQRSKKIQSARESLQGEEAVLEDFKNRGFIVCTRIQIYHPILFYISCIPDAICFLDNNKFLLEVKTVFRKNNRILNEMDEEFNEEFDVEKWKRQLLFSLFCSELDKGVLVLFDYDQQKIMTEIWISKDSSFADLNSNRFLTFYLDWIFYDNSAVKKIPIGVRKIVRKSLIDLMQKQMVKNSEAIKKTSEEALKIHFDREFKIILDSDHCSNYSDESQPKSKTSQEKTIEGLKSEKDQSFMTSKELSQDN